MVPALRQQSDKFYEEVGGVCLLFRVNFEIVVEELDQISLQSRGKPNDSLSNGMLHDGVAGKIRWKCGRKNPLCRGTPL